MAKQTYDLTAGPLRAIFDPDVAALRYLQVGDSEVLRGIYAAVRDADWGTVPFTLEKVTLEQQQEAFTLQFDSVHRQNDIHFVWHGCITGGPDGRLTFSFDGKAKSSFKRNRIGFCVLHPMDAAGSSCTIEHTDGSKTEGYFPKAIAPHQPFMDMRSIIYELPNGLSAKVMMEGDTFEMEDQRNWTDASFKTYCTPLADPFPVLVEKGDRVRQTIKLEMRGDVQVDDAGKTASHFSLTGKSSSLPALGLGAGQRLLDNVELKRLNLLELSHLRVDLTLQDNYVAYLEQKAKEAKELGCKLELALHLSDDAEGELTRLKAVLASLAPLVARVLVFHEDEKSTMAKWLELTGHHLPDVPLAGGTDAFFTELNRERPPTDALDLVTYSLNPQVHAFDNASLVETLPAQAVTVTSAETFSSGKPIIISPITFKMRFNPNATGDSSLSLEQQLDERQHSLFGAAWTLGSLKYLLETSAHSLTYFETVGELGLMPDAGGVYPLYHVFADVSEFAGGQVLQSHSSQPLVFEGLTLHKDGRRRIILTNFTSEKQDLQLFGLTGLYKGRVLDGETLEGATKQPEVFRSSFPLSFEAEGGLRVTLEPYGVLTLDGDA